MKFFERAKALWRAHIEKVDPGEVYDSIVPRERVTLEELARRTGYSQFRTRGALYYLKKQGLAVRLSNGVWLKIRPGSPPLDPLQH